MCIYELCQCLSPFSLLCGAYYYWYSCIMSAFVRFVLGARIINERRANTLARAHAQYMYPQATVSLFVLAPDDDGSSALLLCSLWFYLQS